MRQLVTDDHADAAEVHGIVNRVVVKRRLQYAGGKDDLILRAAVIRIHRRRRHAPFELVSRFADLLDLPVRFEGVCSKVIPQ